MAPPALAPAPEHFSARPTVDARLDAARIRGAERAAMAREVARSVAVCHAAGLATLRRVELLAELRRVDGPRSHLRPA